MVSVISPVKNMLDYLPRMIMSVEKQTYPNWEHVIVDGDSEDGTLNFLLKYKSQKLTYFSEPDFGLYDAINKGILKSKGRYVCILNADDWYEPDFLEKAILGIEASGADWVFGNNMFHYQDGTTRIIPGDPFYEQKSWSTFTRFHHTTVLAKKECFDAVGNFPTEMQISKSQDVKLTICADYKWFLKLQKAGYRGYYVHNIMGHMSWGGVSTSQPERAHWEGKLVALSEFNNRREINRAWKRTKNRHRLKKFIAMKLDILPKRLRSLVRKIAGPKMSATVYERTKQFRI
jgi:glycosyltransferase involved in cell wall biosynthesis